MAFHALGFISQKNNGKLRFEQVSHWDYSICAFRQGNLGASSVYDRVLTKLLGVCVVSYISRNNILCHTKYYHGQNTYRSMTYRFNQT